MAPKPRERKRKRFFFMPGDRDGRRRKPGRERNGDLNTAALFPFAAKTPAGKRNRKSMSRPFCYTVSYRKIFTVFSAGLIDKLS